jgi:hypothetical protein
VLPPLLYLNQQGQTQQLELALAQELLVPVQGAALAWELLVLVQGAAHPVQDLEMGHSVPHFKISPHVVLQPGEEIDNVIVGCCRVHVEPGEKGVRNIEYH